MWQTVPEAGNIGWFGRVVRAPPRPHPAPLARPPRLASPARSLRYASAVAADFAPRLGAEPP